MIEDQPTSPSPAFQPNQAETVDVTQSPRLGSRPAHKEPDSIGPYRVLEKIGEGGMGIVYKAEQREPVRRIVALKVIKLGMDTREVVARFEAERQALAMLSHPNVAKVFDAGATDTGRPYFAMEHVAGVSLTRYCGDSDLSTRKRLELFIPICQAVQHAHQKGIIHRDLKPTNILITLVDGKPVPKVIDFGIAKATNQALTQHTLFTQTGAMIGTPEYMSPEQAMTSGMDVDTRTDIYSLGVILYELLTGTLPLDLTTLKAAGLEGMARLIKTSEPQRPSTRLITLAGAAIPQAASRQTRNSRILQKELQGDLDCIVLMAMEKDRSRRYETANALAMDIQRHLESEPVLARPPSAIYRMQKFIRKHRVGVTAGGAVLLALVLGLALATYGFIKAKADREIADKARIEAQTQKQLALDYAYKAEENAKLATENARKAELRQAERLISQADLLSRSERFASAHQLYIAAYDQFVAMKEHSAAAEMGLWSSYQETAQPLLTFTGHIERVICVAISPDGRRALSGSSDNTMKLWDLATGRELRNFAGHSADVNAVAFAPDGQTALSASADATIKYWDLTSGNEIRTLKGHKSKVSGVAFSPDGRTALSCSNDKTLKLWDLSDGREIRTFGGRAGPAGTPAFSPDGHSARSFTRDKTLTVTSWDLDRGEQIRTFTGFTPDMSISVVAKDGKTVLSGKNNGDLSLWDLESGKELHAINGASAKVDAVAISADNQTAVSGDFEGVLKLWDLTTGLELRTLAGHAGEVYCIAITPNGRFAVSGGRDRTLKLWELNSRKEPRAITGNLAPVTSLAIAPDGLTILSGSTDTMLKLWDLTTGKELQLFTGHTNTVSRVLFTPNGRSALSCSYDKTMKLWDLASGKELHTFSGHTAAVITAAISPDGRTALSGSGDYTSGSRDYTLKLWDLASGTELRTFNGHTLAVQGVAIAPDGRTALSCSDDQTLKRWDLATGQLLRTFTGHSTAVLSVAIAPDGLTALSSDLEGTIKLWDLASGRELSSFSGSNYPVYSIAIVPDGHTAISGGPSDRLRLWDLPSGRELRTFPWNVLFVALAPVGQSVVTGEGKAFRIWDFGRAATQRAFEPRVAAARARLQQAPNDPASLATLGEWYAFRGMDQWAVEFLGRARDAGAAVSPLTMARCYWNMEQNADARREFQIALEQSKDAAERTNAGFCIAGIDTQPERKRRNEAFAAVEKLRIEAAAANEHLKTDGYAELAAGRIQDAIEHLSTAWVRDPDDSMLVLRVGTLRAWLGQNAEFAAIVQQSTKHASNTTVPFIAERVAKIGCLQASTDRKQCEATLALAQKAVKFGKDSPYIEYFYLTLGMAEYRAGHYTLADESLIAAVKSESNFPVIAGTSAFYRVMSLFRQGKEAEARRLMTDAIQTMKPLPADAKSAVTGINSHDDLILWMAYKEAASLLKIEAAPAPPSGK